MLAIPLCVVCIAWGAWLLLPVNRLLEVQAREWLAEQGVDADFTLSRLSAEGLVVRDMRIKPGDALTVEKIEASYNPGDLWNKRVKRLDITGIRLSVAQDEAGTWHIPGLEALFGDDVQNAGGNAALPSLPFDTLAVREARLTVQPREGEAYSASAELTLHGDYTGRLTITEAEAPIGERDSILLTNLSLMRDSSDAAFTIEAESIAHITPGKAYFTPLNAKGEIHLARDNRDVNGIIHISGLNGQWMMKLQGSAALDEGHWEIAFEQPDMTFETGILQPDMIFPVLRGHVAQMGGRLSFHGEAAKAGPDAGITSRGELRLGNLDGVIAGVPVNGVDGAVAFSSLWPPATYGRQSVSVREILLGLPLSNGKMTFTLAESGAVHFFPSTWDWAGGKLHTAGATLNIHDLRLPNITLTAKGLALEQLLGSLLQEGISATGKLEGSLPVSFTPEGDAMIRNGILSAVDGGIVRYAPSADSPLQMGHSFQTDLLLSALENFHYETLSMTINSASADEVKVALHVKGRNPQLYGGQTVELNINLTGNLLDIVQSGMNIYSLPERLEEQLTQ